MLSAQRKPPSAAIELDPEMLDLSQIIRTGDTVFWGQGTSEPLTLTEALVRQRASLGKVNTFIGPSFSGTLQPEHADHLAFGSYCGMGKNQRLSKAGLLDIVPCHYSHLPKLIASGLLACDVVFVQLSAPNAAGELSLGVANDYLLEAARRARTVIAEINDRTPWTYGSEELADVSIDYVVRTSRPMLEVKPATIGDVERRIASFAAQYIPDGAVLETGMGAIPDAILLALRGHRNLGIHSGMIGDSAMDLMESGAVTNSHKPIDRGVTTTGVLFGTERLYRFAHRNPEIRLRPARYTHDPRNLAKFDRFVAINSAIEVDLTGQVNAEVADGVYVGGVGGQIDFVRAAASSPKGRSIIALPSTAREGKVSRIVARLSGSVTTPRSDADMVVTEWGAAELGGQSLKERAKRMIAIAHPSAREDLEREAHKMSSGQFIS